ncbi:hypothetical protein [Lyngbya aestuarii]|uniref:hypothetical protein n=1 Tax=Lyngbya aestuarii TaxID=118322 RepID=UPI00403DC584
MQTKQKTAKSLFLLIAPLVTGSLFGISPTLAATLASSKAVVSFNNFSQAPNKIFTFTDTKTLAIATNNGKVEAAADAQANFVAASPETTQAENISWSTAAGKGSNYLGIGQSFAEVIGYDFRINKDESFSFDFDTLLSLRTSVDNAQSEDASAVGLVDLKLYDTTDDNNWIALDSFTLSGNLTTPGQGDFIAPQYTESITVDSKIDTAFGGNQEYAEAKVSSSYSRYFDSLTYLTLVEAKVNQASVKVPEASNLLGLLWFGLIFIMYQFKNKAWESRAKLAQELEPVFVKIDDNRDNYYE